VRGEELLARFTPCLRQALESAKLGSRIRPFREKRVALAKRAPALPRVTSEHHMTPRLLGARLYHGWFHQASLFRIAAAT